MTEAQKKELIDLLYSELVPALGCTEPIAIAYAAAKARQVLGQMPEHIDIRCSGNGAVFCQDLPAQQSQLYRFGRSAGARHFLPRKSQM